MYEKTEHLWMFLLHNAGMWVYASYYWYYFYLFLLEIILSWFNLHCGALESVLCRSGCTSTPFPAIHLQRDCRKEKDCRTIKYMQYIQIPAQGPQIQIILFWCSVLPTTHQVICHLRHVSRMWHCQDDCAPSLLFWAAHVVVWCVVLYYEQGSTAQTFILKVSSCCLVFLFSFECCYYSMRKLCNCKC